MLIIFLMIETKDKTRREKWSKKRTTIVVSTENDFYVAKRSKDTWSQKQANNSIHQKMNLPFISLDVCAWQFEVLLIICAIEYTHTHKHTIQTILSPCQVQYSLFSCSLFFVLCCNSNCEQLVPHRRFICSIKFLMEISTHGNTYSQIDKQADIDAPDSIHKLWFSCSFFFCSPVFELLFNSIKLNINYFGN